MKLKWNELKLNFRTYIIWNVYYGHTLHFFFNYLNCLWILEIHTETPKPKTSRINLTSSLHLTLKKPPLKMEHTKCCWIFLVWYTSLATSIEIYFYTLWMWVFSLSNWQTWNGVDFFMRNGCRCLLFVVLVFVVWMWCFEK